MIKSNYLKDTYVPAHMETILAQLMPHEPKPRYIDTDIIQSARGTNREVDLFAFTLVQILKRQFRGLFPNEPIINYVSKEGQRYTKHITIVIPHYLTMNNTKYLDTNLTFILAGHIDPLYALFKEENDIETFIQCTCQAIEDEYAEFLSYYFFEK